MKLRIALVILLLLFLMAWFSMKNRDQISLFQVKSEVFNSCFTASYTINVPTEKVFSQTKGTVYPLVGDGEKVKGQEEICLVQGENTVTYKSPQEGLVVFRAKGQVEGGALLFEIVPLEANIFVSLYPEQAKEISGRDFLELQFPFSQQKVWSELLYLKKEGKSWKAELLVRDFLPQLLTSSPSMVTVFLKTLEGVPVIPKEALAVLNGELGVYQKTNNGFQFVPVNVLGSDNSCVAVSGIAPGTQVKIAP